MKRIITVLAILIIGAFLLGVSLPTLYVEAG